MKQLFKHAIILCLILFTSACVDIVDPGKLGLKNELLIVNSLISPDQEVLEVQVSRSSPLFGEIPDYTTDRGIVTDATVTLSRGSSTINLSYDVERQLYTAPAAQLPIVEGGTYTLKVTAGKFTTTATTTVPGAVPITRLRLTPDSDDYRITLNWSDPKAQTNFYRVYTSLQTIEGEKGNEVDYEKEEFHSDAAINGSGMSARGKLYYFGKISESSFNVLVGVLISCDRNYYRYQRIKNNDSAAEDNPFAEASITHTNIEGGAGIFASYVKSPEFVLRLN